MFDKIISGGFHYKIGMYLGIALILLSIGSQVKSSLFEISSTFDWLFLFLVGLFIFFFFMGIALNTDTKINIKEFPDGKGGITRETFEEHITPLGKFTILSQASFWFAGVITFLFLIRLSFIIWK